MNKDRSYKIGDTVMPARPLEPGLYLVATPIGNLRDISLRALETLAAADLIACEDTRTTRVLLDRYRIRTKTVAYHTHNEASAGGRLLEDLGMGKTVALVSDAGTPMISDPGERIAASAHAAGFRIFPIPGASAILAALSIAGLPSERFLFEGFLPAKQGQRRSRLASLASLDVTLIFYEAPHRISETIADMESVFGGARIAAVCRELTKTFEECVQGPLHDLVQRYPDGGIVKGEIVIVVAPPSDQPSQIIDADELLRSLMKEMSASKAAAEASRLTGQSKGDLYKRILAFKTDNSEIL